MAVCYPAVSDAVQGISEFWKLEAQRYSVGTLCRCAGKFSQMLLDDAENVMLMRDDREKKVRTYRNLVSGDLIVTTYDVPLRKQKNRRNLHVLLCVIAAVALSIGLQAVPRISNWNQNLGAAQLAYGYDVSDGLPGVQAY